MEEVIKLAKENQMYKRAIQDIIAVLDTDTKQVPAGVTTDDEMPLIKEAIVKIMKLKLSLYKMR